MATLIQAARCLTVSENTPRVTAIRPNFLSSEDRPTFEGFDSDGPGYLSRRGPRHDNDHVNFHNIQILPTTDEILAVQRPPYMPKKNIEEPNQLKPGPLRLLDTLFRHLRYDSIEGIRDVTYHSAQCLLKPTERMSDDYEPRLETQSGNRYFLYSDVKFEELLSDEKRGVILRLSYICPQFMRGRGMIRSGRLEAGMLCALVGLDDDGKSLSITFFEVHMTQSTDSMRVRNGRGVRAAVQLAFTRPAKHDDVQRMLRYAQGLSSGQYMLVEFPKLLYAGFHHCLTTLQRIQSTNIAFSGYVAPQAIVLASRNTSRSPISSPTTDVSPPAYCTQADFRFNVGCLAENDASFSLSDLQSASGENFRQFLNQSTTLDNGQAVALQDCLTREIAFTQGPPGTGKTFLGIALSRVLLASRFTTNRKPILVVCLTNHALDSFLGGLLDVGITKIARVGRGSKEEWTKKFELHALSRNTRLAQGVWDTKNTAVRNAQTLFAEIEARCKGLNAESATGSLSWPSVEVYLRNTQPEIYGQLTTSNDNPYANSFAFDYWAGGGDLRNLQELRIELETCLLGSAASEGSSISTEGIDRALEQIILHAQQQSSRAEQDNIWKLNLQERQQILRRWKADLDREELVERFSKLQMEHQSAEQAVRKSWQKRDAKCLLEQDVIGLTTTACASNWEMLKTLDLEIVICEEAGEVMEAHTLCSLFPSVQHAIFIGDPQQLRPEVNEQKMSLETAIGSRYRLDESLFERCMTPTDPASRPMPTSRLNIQRRMHPEIADITRLVYPYLQDHPDTILHPSTNGIAERMFWIDHRMPEADPSAASKSHINPYEVEMVTGMIRYLIRAGAYSLGDIAILTPYNGQLAALHGSLKATCSIWLSEKDRKALLDDGLLEDTEADRPRSKDQVSMSDLLRVATVDSFQGEEAKVVILSTVRSCGRPGFLKMMNRINVACSRARDGFYIVGNSETLGQVPMWRQIIEVFAFRSRIGPSLRTCCSRHLDHYSDIYTPQELDLIQDCDIACGKSLPCGHSCQERCHPPELHERLPCTNPCEKVHPCGHQCLRLCSEACGSCRYPIKKQILPCEHSVDILCSGGLSTCKKLVDGPPLPCGHQHSIRCCDIGKPYSCGKKCGQRLSCGHLCQGSCADCRASTPAGGHQPCSSRCDAKLSDCEHCCDSECHVGSPCPPCKQTCQESCAHGPCKNLCSNPCDPCVRPHKGHCSHQAQSLTLCSLPSEVLPCCEPCNKGKLFDQFSMERNTDCPSLVLQCGHGCPSLCGEICPSKGCPQCASDTALTETVLICPACHCALDILELDRRLMSNIYTIDEGGNITGFTSGFPEEPQHINCICGASFYNIGRYSILKQISLAPAVFDRLISRIGKSLNTFSRQILYHEKVLEQSFHSFRNEIRPNPLAANHNRALVTSRAQGLVRLSDNIQECNVSTAIPFERSISWLQDTLPGALVTLTDRSIHLTLSLRLTILQRRARNVWLLDCLRVSKYLVGLEDPSLEIQRMSEVLRIRASKECWKGIAECEDALTKAIKGRAPLIEVEIRLQQIQLSYLLDIALAGDDEDGAPVPTMAPEAPSDSLQKATQLCQRFPDTAGKFERLVTAFGKIRKRNGIQKKSKHAKTMVAHTPAYTLTSLPRTNTYETRKTELANGEHALGCLQICERAGHPYSGVTMAKFGVEGCPECGRERCMDGKVDGMEEEWKRARGCLFEDKFLEAMKEGAR